MRKLIAVFVFLLVFSGTIMAAQSREAYLGNITAIAWLEGNSVLNVAIANESNTRSVVTISTDTWDSRWRPIFSDIRVAVPARSIIVESIRIEPPRRGESLEVVITESRRGVTVPVQETSLFKTTSYVVEANSTWEVEVDLMSVFTDSRVRRLILDDFYTATGSSGRGRIQVSAFEGGWKYVASRNAVEYADPEMTLSMRTPQTNGLSALTFSISKVLDGYRLTEEEVPGPTILVYGRNMRLVGSTGSTGSDSGWISK